MHNSDMAKSLLAAAINESVWLAEHVINIARRSASQRVAHFFLDLFVRLNRRNPRPQMGFDMPITQELIADALGLTTVHVNRTLRTVRNDKLVAIDGKHVTILDYDSLSRLGDYHDAYLFDSMAY